MKKQIKKEKLKIRHICGYREDLQSIIDYFLKFKYSIERSNI